MPGTVVLKFGGSSLRSTDHIKAAARRIKGFVEKGFKAAVVVSAMGDRTDRLLDMARAMSHKDPCSRELDRLLATGETESAALMAMALDDIGVKSRSFDGFQAGFKGSGRHFDGQITAVDPLPVSRCLNSGAVAVVTGFQAADDQGDVITLGRGGSDLSAVALASALDAERCYIFTDVDGIYTADPKTVPGARKLCRISWDECLEMTEAGAKVLQAKSVEMAMEKAVEICVLSSFGDDLDGTWISGWSTALAECR